jgi:uncharacterized protein with HEPN domain
MAVLTLQRSGFIKTLIEQLMVGIEFVAFLQNLEKAFAVSKAIKIIGEAAKRIPDFVRRQ